MLLVDVWRIRSQHRSKMCLIIRLELCLAGDRNRRPGPKSGYQFLAKLPIDSQRAAHFKFWLHFEKQIQQERNTIGE